jgi:hypothetical protein
MIGALLLLLQLQGTVDPGQYSTPALREMVERAARFNSSPDPGLDGYRAEVETEIAVGYRDTLGIDRVTQTEQIASRVEWSTRAYEQTVIGYRSQAIGTSLSVLSMARGWTVPSLYGSVLHTGLLADTSSRRRSIPGARRTPRRPPVSIHPFAPAAGRFYGYSGGDTVTVIRSRYRDVPIARIRTAPRMGISDTAIVFEGDLDIDATTGAIVRMRGKLVRVDPDNASRGATATRLGAVAVAFVEFVNAEFEESFWLPTYQRTELQGGFALTGSARSVLRVVSRFTNHQVDTRADTAARPLTYREHRLLMSAGDSLRAYEGWDLPIGAATQGVAAMDFEDIVPDAWGTTGRPRVRLRARRASEVARFNRVEGLFTGLAGELQFRDAAPGLSLTASGGWAWSERTARGEVAVRQERARWTTTARASRALASTNDFSRSSGTALIPGILGVDDHDYVDRWSIVGGVMRSLDHQRRSYLLLEVGPTADRAASVNVERGLLSDTTFRINRGVREWNYLRGVATLALRSDVSGTFLQRGVGTTLRWERGQSGSSAYNRLEANLLARHDHGPFTFVGRASAGRVFGDMPPQSLFELGGGSTLPGYRYKEFAGDAAAAGRGVAMYSFPLMRSPIRLTRRYVIPSPTPGLAAGLTGGWTAFTGDRARSAAAELGVGPLSGTGHVRATVDLRFTLFNGAASAGVARPLDGSRGWRIVMDLAQPF